jgi:AcrR family transcriptional regulator
MSDETATRPYTKRKRAQAEDATRRRIAASAMELHGSVGPARTSISAVAERAGVRRSTVYRHFPDEVALFAACTAHHRELHPPPDPGPWAAIEDPDERLTTALGELYGFYRATGRMLENVIRDEPLVDAYDLDEFRGFLRAVGDLLATGLPRTPQVRAAVGLAVAFGTWQSLTRDEELDDGQAVELMRRLVRGAGDSR